MVLNEVREIKKEIEMEQKFKIDRFFTCSPPFRVVIIVSVISLALCSMRPIQDSDMVQLSNGMNGRFGTCSIARVALFGEQKRKKNTNSTL